jgi:putative DNA primase/helicase
MSRFEQAAVELAARGYFVFPCASRGKAPLTENGFKNATRDERQILH